MQKPEHANARTNVRRTFLHVGSGRKDPEKVPTVYRGDEWLEVRLDIDPDVEPDVVGDIRNMAEVSSAALDAVYSSHNLEHLYAHEVPLALGEFFRVLKPGGHALVTCPDLQAVAAFIAEGKLLEPVYSAPAGPITPLDILYGHRGSLARGKLFMAHRTGFTAQTLAGALVQAGFADIRVQRRGEPYFDLWAVGYRRSG